MREKKRDFWTKADDEELGFYLENGCTSQEFGIAVQEVEKRLLLRWVNADMFKTLEGLALEAMQEGNSTLATVIDNLANKARHDPLSLTMRELVDAAFTCGIMPTGAAIPLDDMPDYYNRTIKGNIEPETQN
jgi:hypothetical protein